MLRDEERRIKHFDIKQGRGKKYLVMKKGRRKDLETKRDKKVKLRDDKGLR